MIIWVVCFPVAPLVAPFSPATRSALVKPASDALAASKAFGMAQTEGILEKVGKRLNEGASLGCRWGDLLLGMEWVG